MLSTKTFLWIPLLAGAAVQTSAGCDRRAQAQATGAQPAVAKPAPAPDARDAEEGFAAGAPTGPARAVLGLTTGRRDVNGRPVRIACRTCHARMVGVNPDRFRRTKAVFHRQIRLQHGAKTCRTCHRVPTFEDFNLADGAPVPYSQVMRLCGQCHPRRLEEYRHGAHGGMTGYWDRTKGPRERNHCLDCHDAHHPRIDPVQPAPRLRNRPLR